MRYTAQIIHQPAHFNPVAYANIPESWTIFPDNGAPKLPCDSLQDAREVAERFGYTIKEYAGQRSIEEETGFLEDGSPWPPKKYNPEPGYRPCRQVGA